MANAAAKSNCPGAFAGCATCPGLPAALGCIFGAVGTGGLPPIATAGFAPTWGLAGMAGFALIAGGILDAEEAGREVGGVEAAEGVPDAAFLAFQEGTAEPLVT